jgi:hypothetical protein
VYFPNFLIAFPLCLTKFLISCNYVDYMKLLVNSFSYEKTVQTIYDNITKSSSWSKSFKIMKKFVLVRAHEIDHSDPVLVKLGT